MPSPYYPIMLFFFPSRAKEAKKQKKKNAWSQVNDLLKAAFRFRLGLRRLRSAYYLVKTRLSESEAEVEG